MTTLPSWRASRSAGRPLIGQAVDDCTGQKAQETRNEIIQFSFAGAGDTGARSVPGQGHADAENQAADQVADDIRGGTVGKVIRPRPRRR